jgi:hypothetical protein
MATESTWLDVEACERQQEARKARAAAARFAVMRGKSPYYSMLGLGYPDAAWRQWNPVCDGWNISPDLCGIATLDEAIRECDAAAVKLREEYGDTNRPYVVALPIRFDAVGEPLREYTAL